MTKAIKTKYVKQGYAEVQGELIVDETSTTRTVVKRAMTPKGIRAIVARQKKNNDGDFIDVNEVDFRSIGEDCGVKIDIPTAGLKELAIDLYHLFKTRKEQGVKFGEHEYIVAEKDSVLIVNDKNNHQVIQQLIEGDYSEEFWKELAESDSDLVTKLSSAKLQENRQKVIQEFRSSLTTKANDEQYWQEFIESNPWIIHLVFSSPIVYLNGETLVGGKNTSGRSGTGGVATDFLCADETSKSFAVVEIKKPSSKLVGASYRGQGTENEIFSPHNDLTGAIVQAQKQVKTAQEHFSSYLAKDYEDLNFLHPHSVVIIGKYSDLDEDIKLKSFNLFRHMVHAMTIITYDELLRRLEVVYEIDN